MGSNDALAKPEDGEAPSRLVIVSAFSIDPLAVSNERFSSFVNATGYRTIAETLGYSFVFEGLLPGSLKNRTPSISETPWWRAVSGAYWRQPEGPGSNVTDRLDHPVVHVSYQDATAFCLWSGLRLPTEAEWEYAARGGLQGKLYPWGNELTPNGKHKCNIWQGDFPSRNFAEDGFKWTAPVDAYEPNAYGLFNMSGNVWEWCLDWFSKDRSAFPQTDPVGLRHGMARVAKGGSYLCHESYCNRYRVSARTATQPDTTAGNLGFRCVAASGGNGSL